MKLSLEEIKEIKSLNENKMVLWADRELRKTFKTIIDNQLRVYNGIPISWEDIYYEFLYEVPKHIKDFDVNTDIMLKTYLGIRCRYFASNSCKRFASQKHKVMNESFQYDDMRLENKIMDSQQIHIPLDVTILNKEQLFIFEEYFLDGKSIDKIHDKTDYSKHKIRKLISEIKTKLSSQIKN